MQEVERLSPQVVFRKTAMEGAILVCAYDSAEKFIKYALGGAVSLPDLRAMLPALAKEQELIFYCA